MTKYEKDVLRSAQQNHIWLNAFQCINPSKEFCAEVGKMVLNLLDDRDNLIYPDQDSDNENLKRLGQLTPEVVIRVNKS